MYDLTNEDISDMDNFISSLVDFDSFHKTNSPTTKDDHAKNNIIEFAKYKTIGHEMDRGDALGYNNYTKSFINSGGFRGYYDRIDTLSIKEDSRQKNKDELDRVSLLKLKLWFWLFLGAMIWHILRYL
jgi:hypothetical protein